MKYATYVLDIRQTAMSTLWAALIMNSFTLMGTTGWPSSLRIHMLCPSIVKLNAAMPAPDITFILVICYYY